MKTIQTASESPASRVHSTGITGGGFGGFLHTPMENDGTLDYYRHLAETNPDIAALIELIDNLSEQLTIAVAAAITPKP